MSGATASRTVMSPSPLELARSALDRGDPAAGELEAYVQLGRTVAIKVFGGELESVTVAEPRGMGVRAIAGGRVGYAFTADLTSGGIDRVVEEAVANLAAADVDSFARLPVAPLDAYPTPGGLWQPGVGGTNLEEKIRLALAAEAAALVMPEVELVEESMYSDEEARLAIASTAGVEVETQQSFCFAYVMAHAGQGRDRQSGLGFTTGREPVDLDPEQAGRDAGAKARALLGAAPCPTGSYTVVLDREVAAALFSSIVQSLSADAVQKGRSVLAGRLGEAVGSSLVTLLDDGLAPGGMATGPFDGEGVPRQQTILIDAGVLRSYLHDSYTARKQGADALSTGNAGRQSYRSLPGVAASNLVVRRGQGDLADLFRRVKDGLYVESVAGLHSGVNAFSGEISLGVTGRLITNGDLGHPVREVTIATDFVSLLRSVSEIAADARWIPLYGSVSTPSLAVEGVAVSGA